MAYNARAKWVYGGLVFQPAEVTTTLSRFAGSIAHFLGVAVGGLFMIFGNRGLIIRVFLHPPEAEVSTLLLFLLKEMGGMVLMVSAMLFRGSRDPVRNVAVVDGLIVGLVILAITPLLSLRSLDIQRICPGHLVWGRSVIRLVLAAFFFYLRPRETHRKPAGHF